MSRLHLYGMGAMAVGIDEPFSPETAMLGDVPIKDYVPPKKSRRFGRLSKLMYVAAMRALENAGVDDPASIPIICATCVGETGASLGLLEQIHKTKGKVVSPALVPNSVHNAPAGYLSIGLGNRAPSLTVSQGGLSSEAALAAAHDWLSAGVSSMALVVSGDEADPEWISRLDTLRARSLADRLGDEALQEGAAAIVVGDRPREGSLGSLVSAVERRPATAGELALLFKRYGLTPGPEADVRVRIAFGGEELRRQVALSLHRPLESVALEGKGPGSAQAYALNALQRAVLETGPNELLLVGTEVDEVSFLHWRRNV